MAEAAVATFDGAGIYGVEMFVDAAGEVWRAARGCLCAGAARDAANGWLRAAWALTRRWL
jgi:hypothetical protein